MNNCNDFSRFFYTSGLKRVLDDTSTDELSIAFFDYCGAQDIYPAVDELAAALLPVKTRFVSALATRPEWAKKIRLNYGQLLTPPPQVWYLKDLKMSAMIADEAADSVRDIDVLVEVLSTYFVDGIGYVDTNITRNCLLTAYYFNLMCLRLVRPQLAVVWNAFHPLSRVTIQACERVGVPVAFLEYGVLPATLNLDFKGQMGESAVAVDAPRFNRLTIDAVDRDYAEATLHYLHTSGINRKPQPARRDLERSVQEHANGRPVVFYAGHNDSASGLIPYTDYVKCHHSPNFELSHDGAVHLQELCEQNNWFLLYKPHPLAKRGRTLSSRNLMMVTDYNINECVDTADVTVTVLSQTAYIALVRNKPAVLLGYNHLRHSGAIYSASSRDRIPGALRAAIDEGFTAKQRESWIEHIARLLRYYLYRMGPDSPLEVKAQDLDRLAHLLRTAVDTGRFEDFDWLGDDSRRELPPI